MSQYRIVSNGKYYKIQSKSLFSYYDVSFRYRINLFDTEKEATELANELLKQHSFFSKKYKPVKYIG